MNPKNFISIGESMVELQNAAKGLYRLGFAGDTLNTAWYVRALTQPSRVSVDYLTAIGADQLSSEMKAFLDLNGIGTKHIKEIPDRTVGLYLITLTEAERSFTYWRSQSAARLLATNEKHLRTALTNADCIYFSGITLAILSPEHRAVFLSVLRDKKLSGSTIVFDSNSRRRLWPSDPVMMGAMVEGYKVSTLALPTFDDEKVIFGDGSSSDCLRRIAGYGVEEIVVKDGPNPCLVFANGVQSLVASQPVQNIIDTTGAGDSFNGGYIAARLVGKDPLQSAELAHRVAGRVICGHGALLDMANFKYLELA